MAGHCLFSRCWHIFVLWCHSEQLSSGTSGVYSPRLSPDQCRIIYLECSVYGPHMQCSRLCMVRARTSIPTWDTFTFSKHNNSTFDFFIPVWLVYKEDHLGVRCCESICRRWEVRGAHLTNAPFYSGHIKSVYFCDLADGFTGIYSSQLSPQCWSADSQRIIIASPQRSRKVLHTTIIYPSLSAENWRYSLWSCCFLKELLMVDINTGSVTNLTSSESYLL